MKKYSAVLAMLLIFLVVGSSHAWVRVGVRGGWRWHGPRVGVYLGPDPWWYDPYDYDYPYYPYYAYPPYPYQPYATPAYPQVPAPYPAPATNMPSQTTPPAPDHSRHNLKYINSLIAHARNSVKFQYDDGDISREQRDEALRNIDEVEKEAKAEAAAQGGTITGDQERALWDSLRTGNPPSTSSEPPAATSEYPASAPEAPSANTDTGRHDLKGTLDQISSLHRLLDKKLANGDITKAQHDAESSYLNQLEKVAQAQARSNGGKLTDNQENALREELLHTDSVIQRNLVVH